jgi:hypothetical protein
VWKVTKVNVHFIGVLFVVPMLVTYVPIIPLALIECSFAERSQPVSLGAFPSGRRAPACFVPSTSAEVAAA